MKQITRRITWGAVLSTVATLVGMWVMLSPWQTIGWETPSQHKASIDKLVLEYQITAGAIQEFRDEWKCDEYYEELEHLQHELRQAQIDNEDTVEIEHDIELLRKKIEKMDCIRFEDFG